MIVKWCVESGPNKSHLWDCAWRDTLQEARKSLEHLPPGQDGKARPYRIIRYRYQHVSKIFDRLIDVKVVEEKNIND